MPEPMGGLSNMGGSVFTIRTDAAPFVQGMKQAEAAARSSSTAISTSVENASRSGSRSLLQLAYAADDLQYGFRSIVNNIPQMLMVLGPGIAGAAGVAAVAINLLITHWGELSAKLQSSWSGGSAEQLKMLAERAETAAEMFEKMAAAKSKFEASGQAGIETQIVKEGAQKLRLAVTNAMLAGGQGAALDPLADEARRALNGAKPGPETARVIKRAETAQFEATARMAAELIGQTQLPGDAGKNARLKLQGLMDANPGAFSAEMRGAVKAGSPEAQKAEADFKKQQEVKEEVQRRIKADTKAKDDEADAKAKIVAGVEKQNFDEAKTRRLQALEDQREAVQRQLHADQEVIWQKQHLQHAPQILESARAAIDMYQKGIGGADSPRELAKRAHALQEAANKKLQTIADELKKEQRIKLPR